MNKLAKQEEVDKVPEGQIRAVRALVDGGDECRTYAHASTIAGVSVNTLKTHLRRVRVNHPKVWASLQVLRKRQLGIRHKGAIRKAGEHTQNWVDQRIGYRMSMRMMYGHDPLDVYAYLPKALLRYYKKMGYGNYG